LAFSAARTTAPIKTKKTRVKGQAGTETSERHWRPACTPWRRQGIFRERKSLRFAPFLLSLCQGRPPAVICPTGTPSWRGSP
jgi:hypothetical protein